MVSQRRGYKWWEHRWEARGQSEVTWGIGLMRLDCGLWVVNIGYGYRKTSWRIM